MVWCQTSGNSPIIIEGRVVSVTVQCTLGVVMHTQMHARSTGELLYEKLAVTREKHVRKRGPVQSMSARSVVFRRSRPLRSGQLHFSRKYVCILDQTEIGVD